MLDIQQRAKSPRLRQVGAWQAQAAIHSQLGSERKVEASLTDDGPHWAHQKGEGVFWDVAAHGPHAASTTSLYPLPSISFHIEGDAAMMGGCHEGGSHWHVCVVGEDERQAEHFSDDESPKTLGTRTGKGKRESVHPLPSVTL